VPEGPDEDSDHLRLTILGAISVAQQSVTVFTPYFLPDAPIIKALNVAALRGVSVRIVLPEENNIKLVQWAATAQLWQVLQRGCRVFYSPPPFDHTKLMLVDNGWSLVGSTNWDPRSLRLNFEFNVECYSMELNRELTEFTEAKIAMAREITLEEVDARSITIRLRDGVARLFSPYL
jgi:cardiolipin synthase